MEQIRFLTDIIKVTEDTTTFLVTDLTLLVQLIGLYTVNDTAAVVVITTTTTPIVYCLKKCS